MQLTRPARVKLPASVNFATIRPVHVRPPEPPTFAVFEFRILAASADQVPTMLLLEDGVVVEVAEVVGLAEGDPVDPSLEVPLQAVSTPASATAHIELRMTGLKGGRCRERRSHGVDLSCSGLDYVHQSRATG